MRAWIDDAVELLSSMPFTCGLDAIERLGPMSQEQAAWLLGVTRQQVSEDLARALRKVKEGARADV